MARHIALFLLFQKLNWICFWILTSARQRKKKTSPLHENKQTNKSSQKRSQKNILIPFPPTIGFKDPKRPTRMSKAPMMTWRTMDTLRTTSQEKNMWRTTSQPNIACLKQSLAHHLFICIMPCVGIITTCLKENKKPNYLERRRLWTSMVWLMWRMPVEIKLCIVKMNDGIVLWIWWGWETWWRKEADRRMSYTTQVKEDQETWTCCYAFWMWNPGMVGQWEQD